MIDTQGETDESNAIWSWLGNEAAAKRCGSCIISINVSIINIRGFTTNRLYLNLSYIDC